MNAGSEPGKPAQKAPAKKASKALSAPTPLARRFVRYVAGFGLAVGLGLAPFLGKIRVPGFEPLLSLFPLEMQPVLIPLSAFLMGVVAVVVQFYSEDRLGRGFLAKRFKVALGVVLGSLLLLMLLRASFVLDVPVLGGEKTVAVVLAGERRAGCGCEAALSDLECVRELSVDPAALSSCWEREPRARAGLALGFSYLALTSAFGALVGLLLLREQNKRKRRRSRRSA